MHSSMMTIHFVPTNRCAGIDQLPVRAIMKTSYSVSVYVTILATFAIAHPRRQLRYSLFISGPDSSFDSSGSIPAIEIAEEEILNEPSLLTAYALHHTPVEDTMVSRYSMIKLM